MPLITILGRNVPMCHLVTDARDERDRRPRSWVAVRTLAPVVAGTWLACSGPALGADARVGEIAFAQGLATGQRAGDAPRFLTAGDAVVEGDTVTTSSRGYVVVNFKDGAKMTLRPGTVFSVDRYAHDAGEENSLMRLVRGGMRAITGLIGKRNPDGVTVSTATATIGIRGTEFDARLCGAECQKESERLALAAPAAVPGAPVVQAVGRVSQMTGSASAAGVNGESRILVEGSPLYSGESVRTGRASSAVIAFRDESKVTVQPNTSVRIEDYRYEAAADTPSSMVLRLLRGGLRAVTGLIGKREPRNVQFQTAVATIGIRGTGVDLLCEGDCAAEAQAEERAAAQADRAARRAAPTVVLGQSRYDGLFVYTWDGTAEIRVGTQVLPVPAGAAVLFDIAASQLQTLSQVPTFMVENPAPRPDGVPVDMQNTFGTVRAVADDPGVYLSVKVGHATLVTPAGQRIDASNGETVRLVAGAVQPQRLDVQPIFIRNDPVPSPTSPALLRGAPPRFIEGRTGRPGSDICEM